MRLSSCTTNTDTNEAGTNRHRAEKSGRGQERIFEFLPLVSLLGNCFPTDMNCVVHYLHGCESRKCPRSLAPTSSKQILLGCTPPHLLPFTSPLQLFFDSHQLRSRQCNTFATVCVFFKACEVTSHSVFLDMESVHGGSVVFFPCIGWPILCILIQKEPMSSSGPLLRTEHACVDPRAPQEARCATCFFRQIPRSALPCQTGQH